MNIILIIYSFIFKIMADPIQLFLDMLAGGGQHLVNNNDLLSGPPTEETLIDILKSDEEIYNFIVNKQNNYDLIDPKFNHLISQRRNLPDSNSNTLTNYDQVLPDEVYNILTKTNHNSGLDDIIIYLSLNDYSIYYNPYSIFCIRKIELFSRLLMKLINFHPNKLEYKNDLDVEARISSRIALKDPTIDKILKSSFKGYQVQFVDNIIENINIVNCLSDQNIKRSNTRFLNELINYKTDKEINYRFLLVLLKQDRNFLCSLTVFLYKHERIIHFMDKDELIFLLTRGYSREVHISNAYSRWRRYKKILPILEDNEKKLMFKKLHDSYIESPFLNSYSFIVSSASKKMEDIILTLSEETTGQISETLKIMYPELLEISKYLYLKDNLLLYNFLFHENRENLVIDFDMDIDDLKYLTDEEIFRLYPIRLNYSSRDELLTQISYYRKYKGFYIKRYDVKNEILFINEETSLLTPTSDRDELMICYGDLKECYGILVDELLMLFSESETEAFFFGRPDKYGNEYSKNQVKNLLNILQLYRNDEKVKQLINLIKYGLVKKSEMVGNLSEVKNIMLERCNEDDINIIHEILRNLFDCGMYMRRWKGPGYKYPVDKDNTYNMIDPEVLTRPLICTIIEKIDNLNDEGLRFIKGLVCIENIRGTMKLYNIDILSLLGQISMGQVCIRESSVKIIDSAYYYLIALFDDIIDNYEPGYTDFIS